MTPQIIDLTAQAPAEYRVRIRPASEVRAIVLHQTGFAWRPDNPRWPLVKAHFVVRQDGSVLMLHSPLVRMRYGSGACNAQGITVEHEGNYPSDRGQWWSPETMGRHVLSDYPAMVASSRALLADLCAQYPSIELVIGHRHIEAKKSNCPGPSLWSEVGEWAKATLGLREPAPLAGGLALPDTWRAEPRM